MTRPTPSIQDLQDQIAALAPLAIARLRQIAATGEKARDRNNAMRTLRKYGLSVVEDEHDRS